MNLGFIGGTGLSELPDLGLRTHFVRTGFGQVEVKVGQRGTHKLAFMPRHGGHHESPPHQVNYRANIAAMKALGTEVLVTTSAVGTLNPDLAPGSLALVSDFIDLTDGRPRTFFDDKVIHVDVSTPYCPGVRAALTASAGRCGLSLAPEAVYLCTSGPRFESPAEIRCFRGWGADLVGMTNLPEAVLAREAEICYATVAVATNHAAGVTGTPLSHGEVEEMMAARAADLRRLINDLIETIELPDCPCRHALDEYRAKPGNRGLSIPL